MPPKKSRKQSNPRKSKAKTKVDKLIEEALVQEPAPIEKSVTATQTRSRSRANQKSNKIKKSMSQDRSDEVKNTQKGKEKRLQTLVKGGNVASKDDEATNEEIKSPAISRPHSSSKQSQRAESSDHESSGSDDDDPVKMKQKMQRRERYEKKANDKGSSPNRKNQKSHRRGQESSPAANTKKASKLTSPTPIKPENDREKIGNPTQSPVNNQPEREMPIVSSVQSSRKINRNKSGVKSSGIKIKTKNIANEHLEPEDSKIEEENLALLKDQIEEFKHEESKSSKALSIHSHYSQVDQYLNINMEEVKQSLNEKDILVSNTPQYQSQQSLNEEKVETTKIVDATQHLDSKKSSRKLVSLSKQQKEAAQELEQLESFPKQSEDKFPISINQTETLPDQTVILNIQSGKSSRLSHQQRENRPPESDPTLSVNLTAPIIKKVIRKGELPLPVIPELPTTAIKLSEEEIRLKYQDNQYYQEWQQKHQYFKKQLDAALKKGLPKLYQTDEEMDAIENDHSRLSQIRDQIRDKLHEFKFSQTDPSGEDPLSFNFDLFIEDFEAKQYVQKLIAFLIEGSSLNIRELKKKCYNYLATEHLSDLSGSFNEFQVELLILGCATRKSYGVKPKSAILDTDQTALALWCYEISDFSLLEPVTESQIKKARSQRQIVGKKIQLLSSFLDMCENHTTFDSDEKISKLNEEFQSFQKLSQKENTTEWVMRKRKHHEISESGLIGEGQNKATNSKNGQRQVAKKIKANNYEESQSELMPISEAADLLNIDKSNDGNTAIESHQKKIIQQVSPMPQPSKESGTMYKFFQRKDKLLQQENPSQFQIKTKDELQRNPHIQYAGICQTEALRIQQACSEVCQSWFDAPNIIDRFKAIKAVCDENLPSFPEPPRPKNIQMHDSAMHYNNVIFHKQSRILNCRFPFEKDPTMIDYDQDSDEEWEELHGENLEDDDLLDEENMEVVEDEEEMLSLPSAGVSQSIKQTLAFRSQYCQKTNQFMGDAEELIQEGFVVPDDYVSEDSDELDQSKTKDSNNRQLLKQVEDRFNQKVKSNKYLTPYILFHPRVNLVDYKAISLQRRRAKPLTVSRISFVNTTSEVDTNNSSFALFPLSVESKKHEDQKLQIKDVANDLVEHAHASFFSKKQLIEEIKTKYADLKKTHIEAFVKECFEKKKQPLDSKVRLHAQPSALEKYGVSEAFIMDLPRIYEDKLATERLLAAEALANNPQIPQQPAGQKHSEEGEELMQPPPPAPPKQRQSNKPRQSANIRASSKHSAKDLQASEMVSQPPSRLSEVPQAQEPRLSNVAIAGSSISDLVEKDQFEGLLSVKSSTNNEEVKVQHTNGDYTTQIQPDGDGDVVMTEENLDAVNEENSWNRGPSNVNPHAFIETPAFNSKIFELPSTEQRNNHVVSQSLDEEPQLQLSQHAIVLPYNADETIEEEHVHIGIQNFNRSLQQYQSTPIHDFRTLRSREISVNHSQNGIEENHDHRPRSDSMETDKGNPLQNQAPVTDSDDAMILNQELQRLPMNEQTFNSPPSQSSLAHHLNLTKSNFEHLNQLIILDHLQVPIPEEEQKEIIHHQMRDHTSFGAVPLYSGSVEDEEFKGDDRALDVTFAVPNSTNENDMTASKRHFANYVQEIPTNTRRSRRLESRHNTLLQMQSNASGFDDDELNQTYSQHSQQNVSHSRRQTPRRSQSKSRGATSQQ